MGLDLVELVMEVEKTFGIRFDDEDYPCMQTVGDMHDVIVRKGRRPLPKGDTASRGNPPCLTLIAFVRLRQALTHRFALSRNTIRPETRLDGIIPRRSRGSWWSGLEEGLALKLPRLERPPWLRTMFGIAWLPLGVFLFVFCALAWDTGPALLVFPTLGAAYFLAWRVTQPLATYLGPELCTVGGLSRRIASLNYPALAAQDPVVQRDDVMATLIEIISKQLMIPRNEITREKSFIEDLGCG